MNGLTSVEELEQVLSRSLQPVRPDPEFVYRLGSRLDFHPRIVIERRAEARTFLMVTGGLLAGVFALWFVWRLGKYLKQLFGLHAKG